LLEIICLEGALVVKGKKRGEGVLSENEQPGGTRKKAKSRTGEGGAVTVQDAVEGGRGGGNVWSIIVRRRNPNRQSMNSAGSGEK